jgi:predicted metalloprotease with PDZ domain
MPAQPIRYHVAMPEPQSHELHVTMEIPALPERQSIEVLFPVWAPGSYLVRDFSRHVYDLEIRGEDGRRSVDWQRLDKARWRIATGGRKVVLRYRVFAFEVSVRTSFLDDERAFLNGTSLFFLVEGETGRPCVLQIEPPSRDGEAGLCPAELKRGKGWKPSQGFHIDGWQVSTALPALPGQRHCYRAEGYDELVDSPVEIGTHERFDFHVEHARIEVALQGRTNVDRRRMLATMRAIVETTGAMFGGLPFERYLFIIHALPNRGGGLEHACSTTLDISGFSFEDEKGYQSFAELAAHEFFHTWNVKRIRDRVLGPFDYGKENYTELLWFHEGFTEYAQALVLLRAGLLSVERYLKDLAESWGRYISRPGRNVTPLSQLSYEAWIKQYRPAENHANRMVSYYDKGRWAGLVLDLQMRLASEGRRGVPDLFRRLWQRYGAHDRGIDAALIRREAEELAGHSLGSYFSRFIDGTLELPVPALLKKAGIAVAATAYAEQERGDLTKAARLRAWSGMVFGNGGDDAAVVKNVVPGSPAWRAGITYADEVVAVDRTRVNATTVSKRLADAVPGQEVQVTFFRKDQLHSARFRMLRNPERRWTFGVDKDAPSDQRNLRQRWLGVRA